MSASQVWADATAAPLLPADKTPALVETGWEFSFANTAGKLVGDYSTCWRLIILTPPLTVLIFTFAVPWPRLPFRLLLTGNSFFTSSAENSLVMPPLTVETEN